MTIHLNAIDQETEDACELQSLFTTFVFKSNIVSAATIKAMINYVDTIADDGCTEEYRDATMTFLKSMLDD